MFCWYSYRGLSRRLLCADVGVTVGILMKHLRVDVPDYLILCQVILNHALVPPFILLLSKEKGLRARVSAVSLEVRTTLLLTDFVIFSTPGLSCNRKYGGFHRLMC